MKTIRMMGVAAAVALGCAAPALAQEQEPFSRSYVSALAGSTVGSDHTPVFAAEYGERVTPRVQAYVNFTYFDDLMTNQMRANLAGASALLTSVTNSPWSFSGRDRGLAFAGGAKLFLTTSGALRPYVGAGFGALNLRRTIVEQSLGDVTVSFNEEFGVSDANIDSTDTGATKPMAEASGGLNIVAGRTYVDINYRYRKAFHTAEEIDLSQVSVGVGVRF